MSTPGSLRSDTSTSYTPPAPGTGAPGGAPPTAPRSAGRWRPRVFRWRGILPLLLGLTLLAAGWVAVGDRMVRSVVVEAATEALGTQVDLAGLDIREHDTSVRLRGLAIADPFDPTRNLVDAREIVVALEPEPLLEKKLVISRLSVRDVRVGQRRATPARPVRGGGLAPQVMRELRGWAQQFRVPLLALTPIDTIRAIALDPTQLGSVQRAVALRERTDSVRGAWQDGYAGLRLQETYDSTRAVLQRLNGATPVKLGLDGTRRAVADVQRTLEQIKQAKARVEALERSVRAGVVQLDADVHALDDARRADYAFARGLLKLPTFEGPEIGNALFGQVSIDRFQQVMYWAALAERYVPPGLKPKETTGPERLRRSGTTVRFPKARAYPDFLLREGDISIVQGGDGAEPATFGARVQNLTSAPALVGKPTVFAARGRAEGMRVASLRAVGVLNHLGAQPRDSVVAEAGGVALPGFALPGLPLRLEPGQGTAELRFVRVGDRIDARWSVRSTQVRWVGDPAGAAAPAPPMLALVTRVLTGIQDLQLDATLTGPMRTPTLAVRSNLDRAVAERLRAVAGEEIARAEARVRAEVDRLVDEKTAPVRAQVAAARAEAERRVADARQRLDDERARLDAQLKSLTAPAGGLLRGIGG